MHTLVAIMLGSGLLLIYLALLTWQLRRMDEREKNRKRHNFEKWFGQNGGLQ